MAGLDRKILDQLDHNCVIESIKVDLPSDFILAPHYNAIFSKVPDKVFAKAKELCFSGNYQPNLPHTISIPKGRGFTRPGSILSPIDRFLYQYLIEIISPILEKQLDRTRTFSQIPKHGKGGIFKPAFQAWEKFQKKVAKLCNMGGFIVKADIANYFERIPHHHLINLMRAASCPPEAVNLLEEMLLAFQERNSFGIVQGVFPSDVLGNFFLSEFDAYCELHDIPSARYADDIYLQFPSKINAEKGLVDLIERLRKNGLHLNESKSGIHSAERIIREETELDPLFEEAREEIRTELQGEISTGYGFTAEWEWEVPTEEDVELRAVERLYKAISKNPKQADKIEKFCLPLLRRSGSDSAVNYVLKNLVEKPHLTRIYHAYLSRFVPQDQGLVRSLESTAQSSDLVTDFQRMYILGSLFNASKIQRNTVKLTLKWLESKGVSKETRAMAALFSAKHGNPNQKRSVRLEYETEPAEYVKGAILYAARYFTTAEKKSCKRAWGGHNTVNTLISQAM